MAQSMCFLTRIFILCCDNWELALSYAAILQAHYVALKMSFSKTTGEKRYSGHFSLLGIYSSKMFRFPPKVL